MSKQVNKQRSSFVAAKQVKIKSINQLSKDYDTNSVPLEGKFYDKRIYVDAASNIEYYPYMFSKTLEHDTMTGFPRKADVDKILDALNEGTIAKLDDIPQATGATRKLEGVYCGYSFNLVGTDPSVMEPSNFYHVDTEAGSFEMAEVYSKALMRDVAFSDYATNATASTIITGLNTYTNTTSAPLDSGSITAQTLFRGAGTDETIGPYISQFLYLPFDYGNISIDQKYASESDYTDSVIKQNWLNIQDGKVDGSITKTAAKYVYNGRVLGAKVHNDPLYQFYYNAALVAFQNGIAPSAYTHARTTAWVSSANPNILASLAHVCQGALRCSWVSKYHLSMKIRPEVYAQRLVLADDVTFDSSQVPGLDDMNSLMDANIKNLVKAANNAASGVNEAYLMLQFPEGSPTHPSWTAGHAVVSGAAVTVLKAMLDCHEVDGQTRKSWPVQAQHSVDGDNLINYTGADAGDMTIVGELNKLASNAALGRDFAGVHYRCDGDCGIDLGEKYAITYLVDIAKEYHESHIGLFTGWLLEKFDGTRIRITHTGIQSA